MCLSVSWRFCFSPSFVTVPISCRAWTWWPSQTLPVLSLWRDPERQESWRPKKSAWLPLTMQVRAAVTPVVRLFGRIPSLESPRGPSAPAAHIQLCSFAPPATSNGSASNFKNLLNLWNTVRPRLSLFFPENSIKRTENGFTQAKYQTAWQRGDAENNR